MKFLKLLAVVFVFYAAAKFCYDKTEGFALTKIHSNLTYDSRWEVENGSLPEIFDQKFSYLAAGGQAYAFVSEDGQYVLKFFKHHLRRVPLWLRALPLTGKLAEKRTIHKQKRARKLLRDFSSYKLALEALPKETGLLYVHLNKTKTLKTFARIVDKIGIEHPVDLDKVEFVLQKKAELALPHLKKLIKGHDLEGAKTCIDSIFSLITTRCDLGVYDEDPRIHRNVGFIDNRAILIDVGRLKMDPRREDPRIQKQDLVKITRPLHTFLEKHSTELSIYLEEKLQ
ncbi:MAG: hypothetical protein P0S96_04545 [Simkaniaceae bacterium]|nr:hypothetical protein [Candidatus Sacchlamyda saccharinae]